ncbi:MAG: PorV/PorQ family protein [Melioribacteraceae bacterium]|nr:PorV/PorQ family protein [Melioribacteraceae bacterium]
MNFYKALNPKLLLILFISFCSAISAQEPYRVGTTTANFLEIGYGTTGNSMGDAFTSIANDASAIYWNPAGLSNVKNGEVMFAYQPWFADINTTFASAAFRLGDLGTIGIGIVGVDYGDMDVTTMSMQNGTGESFSASDISVSLAFSRRLATWFSFGAAAKFISSSIWHSTASAIALDMGVLINTGFFSPTNKMEDGLNIGMSVSNYGTRMKYDGFDLLQPIDPTPNQSGDYEDVEGQYRLNEWELPLIFRLGISLTVLNEGMHKLQVAVDALHPNNNSESVNIGAIYTMLFAGVGNISFSGGYKALFMNESEYGLTLGVGFHSYMLYNQGWKVGYSYREHETFGGTHSYGVSLFF